MYVCMFCMYVCMYVLYVCMYACMWYNLIRFACFICYIISVCTSQKLVCTYYMAQLEPRVTLVVLASTRGSKDRDSKITNWMSDIAIQLRNTFVSSLLRPQ